MHKIIAVIGSSSTNAANLKLAEALGREIAAGGFALLCGGLGGVMEAACRGAASVDGHPPIIGLLPGKVASAGNRYLDLSLPTGLGIARNTVIANCADGLVCIEGGSGTLSEMAFAWQLGKPLVALESSGGWAAKLVGESLDERRKDKIVSATSATQAIELLKDLIS